MSILMFTSVLILIVMATLAGALVGAVFGITLAGALKMELEGLYVAHAVMLTGALTGFVAALYWAVTYA